MTATQDTWVTIATVAQRYRVPHDRVRKWVSTGLLQTRDANVIGPTKHLVDPEAVAPLAERYHACLCLSGPKRKRKAAVDVVDTDGTRDISSIRDPIAEVAQSVDLLTSSDRVELARRRAKMPV